MRQVNSSDNLREALQDSARSGLYKEWVSQRANAIRDTVTVYDVLRHFGVSLKYAGDDNEEQISCPFHGEDNSPSARVYPQSARSSSHVWCFVCNERWDVFALWKKFQGEDQKFTQLLFGIERAFGLTTPEAPEVSSGASSVRGPTEREQEVLSLLDTCERRLKQAKESCDMVGFLTLGKLLDTLHYQVTNRLIDIEDAWKHTRAILDKIGSKIRA